MLHIPLMQIGWDANFPSDGAGYTRESARAAIYPRPVRDHSAQAGPEFVVCTGVAGTADGGLKEKRERLLKMSRRCPPLSLWSMF